jgi:hypothetical protein
MKQGSNGEANRPRRWLLVTQGAAALAMFASIAACAPEAETDELGDVAEPAEVAQRDQAVVVTGACNSPDRRALAITHGWATDYTVGAYQHFLAEPTSQRAQRWFGSQEPWMYEETVSTLFAMTDIMQHAPVTYFCESGVNDSCSRNPGWAAHVPPGTSLQINICPRFWDMDNQDRLKVLTHEFVHFMHHGHVDLLNHYPEDFLLQVCPFFQADFNAPGHVMCIAGRPDWAINNASTYAYYIMNLAGDPE